MGVGNVFQGTQLSGASVSADFVGMCRLFPCRVSLTDCYAGTGLLLCFTDNGASFKVQLDGQEPAADVPNDLACIGQGASKTISFQNLEFKAHSFVLSVTNASSAHEFRFFGAVMSTSIALLRYGLLDRAQLNFGSLMAGFLATTTESRRRSSTMLIPRGTCSDRAERCVQIK